MRVGCLVAAFVDVGTEFLRQVVRVHADQGERDQDRDAPVPDAAVEFLRPFILGDAEDFLHLFRRPSDPVGTAGPAGGKDLAEGVDLEVVILTSVRILHEELDAAVLPLRTVVLQVQGAEVQSADAEIHDKGVLGAGDAAGAERGVGEFGRPVDLVHQEAGTLELEGGIEVDFLEVGDEGDLYRSHKACMSFSFL